MSLEKDITQITEMIEAHITEGFGAAKQRYVDTIDPATGHGQMPLQILKRLAAKDPTYPDKGKYVEWMAKMYLKQRSARGMDVIADFDKILNSPKYKDRLAKKDINQYASLNELSDAVHIVHALMAEEREKKKEEEVRKLLVKADGNIGKVMHWAAGQGEVRAAAAAAEEEITDEEAARRAAEVGRGSLVRDYGVNDAYVAKIKKKMEKEQTGIFGKDFVIDEDIFNHIDPADVVFENDRIIIVRPLTKEKSILYGRNPNYDPKDPESLESPWCTSYARRSNMWDPYFGRSGDTFQIILPRDVASVPGKQFAKVNVQVAKRAPGENENSPKRLNVWNTSDQTVPKATWMKLFKGWGIPTEEYKNTRE